ncbi:pleckstrin homology domain-containing family M member 1 [Ambystoma mexicanum]|uniref:pleckstrin homology domain-containing family M member 1 n=1 Tax=Ambystoma mexicanum TaxID=8296 RepID=UPI0037E6FD75
MLSTQTPENVLDPRDVKQWIKKKLANSLKALQIRYVTSDAVITSEDGDANTLCSALEAVFIHGLKAKHIKAEAGGRGKRLNGRSSLPQPIFWTLLKTITHRDVITELEHLNFINTDVGRCRAWLRLALNECLMECYLILLLRERSRLADYYQPIALLLDVEDVEVILSYVQGLSSLTFELSYKSAVLNEWTMTPLSLAGLCTSPELQMDPLITSASQAPRKKSWDSMSQSSGSDDTDTHHSALLPHSHSGKNSKCGSSTLSLDTNGSSQLSSSFGSDGLSTHSGSKSPDKSEELLSCDTGVAGGNVESDTSLQDPPNETHDVCLNSESSGDLSRFLDKHISKPSEEAPEWPSNSPVSSSLDFTRAPMNISENPKLVLGPSNALCADARKECTPTHNTGLHLSNGYSLKNIDVKDYEPGQPCTDGRMEAKVIEKVQEQDQCTSLSVTLPKSTSWISEEDIHVAKTQESMPSKSFGAPILNGPSFAFSDVEQQVTQTLKSSSSQESKGFSVVHRRQMGLSNPFRGLLMLGHLERRGAVGLWKEFFCELSPFEFRLLLSEEDRTCFENCSLLRCESVGEVHSEGRFELLFSDKKLCLRASCQNVAQDWVERLREALHKCRPPQNEPWEVLQVPDFSDAEECNVSQNMDTEEPQEIVYDWISKLPAEKDAVKESTLYMKQGTVWRGFVFSLSLEALQCFRIKDHEKVLYCSYGIETIRDIIPDTSLGGPAFFRVLTSKASLKLQAASADEAKSWREIIRCVLESYQETSDSALMNGCDWDESQQMTLTFSEKERSLLQCLTAIPTEKGLDSQSFKCAACPRQIGFSFGKSKLCAFSGLYYCDSCHRDEESVIPSRIIHNWDLSKRTVCRPALTFLNRIRNEPLINMRSVNESVYIHVEEMSRIARSREQLKLLGEYLYTCRSGALQEMSRRLDHRNYLLEAPQKYSITDLQQITEGIFEVFLQSVIQFASDHIYDCDLCSQRGFICQICNKDDIIFPFEFDTTTRCKECKTVFHSLCKVGVPSCPRCVRRRKYYEAKKSAEL